MKLSKQQVTDAIESLGTGDGKKALEILEALLVSELTGEAAGEPPPPAEAGATASNAEVPPPAPGDKPAEEMAALSRGVVAMFAGKTAGEALELVRSLKADSDRLAADRAALEDSERRGLVAELVTLGIDTPATAWEDVEAKGDARKPCARLAAEPLADLRKRVSLIKTSRGARMTPVAGGHAPPAPATAGGEPGKLTEADLSPEELSKANEITDPKKRARFVELRLSRRAPRA
jgi:hypothetical protein